MSKNNNEETSSLIKKAMLALVTIVFLILGAQMVRKVANR